MCGRHSQRLSRGLVLVKWWLLALPHYVVVVRAAGSNTCFVVNEQQLVLGQLGRAARTGHDEVRVERAMSAGPSTVRPSLDLDRAVERMRRQHLTTLPVTTSGGRLLGLLERDTAERALHELIRDSARTLSEGSRP
jgi:Mg/Co/Ni transporter MgtE